MPPPRHQHPRCFNFRKVNVYCIVSLYRVCFGSVWLSLFWLTDAYHLQLCFICPLSSEGSLFNVTNPPLRYYVAWGCETLLSGDLEVVTQTGECNQDINKFTSEWLHDHDCIAVRPCSIVTCMCNVPFYPLLTLIFFGVLLGSCNVELRVESICTCA